MQTVRLETESFLLTDTPSYVDEHKLFELFDALAWRAPLCLSGPPGVAKSLSVQAWASRAKVPFIDYACSEDTRRAHLVGMLQLHAAEGGESTPFVLGPLPTAIEVANECGYCVLCLDEVSALAPTMQKVLNPLLDFRKSLTVPEARRVFRLERGAKLWIVATMNTVAFGGVYALNTDLKSRFNIYDVSYYTEVQERFVLEAIVPTAFAELDGAVVDAVLRLVTETRAGKFDYAISTRDAAQYLENIQLLGPRRASYLLRGKFDGEDVGLLNRRLISLLDVDLDEEAAA